MNLPTIPCSRLRHKSMYVMSTDNCDDGACYDPYNATAFWCIETQKPLGPDGRPVNEETCKHGRECCKG